ncbi:MAG: immunoglobulin-like domain-containing protein [Candidatus Paceibacterota bacterium]
MKDEIFIKGEKYITTKSASELTNYTSDYVGQLSRSNKIKSTMIGHTRYVCEDDILNYGENGGVLINDKKYISTKKASELTGYTSDYVGQISRSGIIKSKLVGKTKFVEEIEILEYAKKFGRTNFIENNLNEEEKDTLAKKIIGDKKEKNFVKTKDVKYFDDNFSLIPELKKDREGFSKEKYLSEQTKKIISPFEKPTSFASDALFKKVVALCLAITVILGPYAFMQTPYAEASQEKLKSLANNVYEIGSEVIEKINNDGVIILITDSIAYTKNVLKDKTKSLAVNTASVILSANVQKTSFSIKNFAKKIYVSINSLFGKNEIDENIELVQSDNLVSKTPSSPSSPSSPSLSDLPLTKTVVIEGPTRIVERILEKQSIVSGISKEELESKIQQLDNKLSSKIYAVSSGTPNSVQTVYQMVSQTNKIDKLVSGVEIVSPAITGGTLKDTIVTGSTFSGTTMSGSTLTLTGGATVGGQLIVSGISTSTIAGDTNFDTGTLFIDSLNNRIGIGTSTPQYALDIVGTLNVSSIVTSAGETIGGNLDITGNTTLGNATTSDKTYFNSRIGTSLIPTIDNVLDIGDSSNWLRWRSGFFGTSVGIGGTSTSTGSSLLSSGVYTIDSINGILFNTTNNASTTFGTGLVTLPNLSGTNATTTNSTSTNLYSSTLVAGNATTTNFYTSIFNAVSGIFSNLITTTFTATNSTTTNATSTTLAITNTATTSNLIVSNDTTISSLTPSRLVSLNSSRKLTNTDLFSWVSGTTNQITITDDSDGTITLSLPQNIHTSANPTFNNLTLTGTLNTTGLSSFTQASTTRLSVFDTLYVGGTSTTTITQSAINIPTGGNYQINGTSVLSATVLGSGVLSSSLTSVGTLSSLTIGGTLAMGANNITSTGSLGATGARILKGWFTDLESTNAIVGSITGNAATVTTNANLTGPITSVGNATAIASQTGTGTKFVVDTSPTLITPQLGYASSTQLSIGSDYITDINGTGLTLSAGGVLSLNATGNWTGTFDNQEGSYYLDARNLTNFGSPFYTYFSATTTDALTQGSTNKYWSQTLFDNALTATTTLPKITALTSLSITKSQVSDFGTYENPLTFNYPLSRSVNAISTVATSSLGLLVGSFASPNISQWTNNSNYIALTNLSATNPITYNNGTGAIGWTNSNNYIALTDLSATYPIIKTSGVFSTGFGTTTTNIFSALNTFANATTTLLTAPDVWITKLRNLTSNGFIKTSGGDGTLSIDTNTYLTTVGSGTNGNLAYWNGTNTLTGVATTTLTATAPMTLSQPISVIGSSASVLTCATASGSVSGCLSSTDWTTFNNKGSGTITSIATNNGLTGGTITTSGTIGLNTAGFSTNALLTWNGSNLVATGTPALTAGYFIATTTTATSTFAGGLTAGSNSALVVESGATANSLYVKTNGNVGIGTVSPGEKLDVVGVVKIETGTGATTYANREAVLNFGAANYLTTYRNRITNSISSTLADATMNFEVTNGASTYASVMTLTGAGNVGIGTTSPYAKLSIEGTSALGNSALAGYFIATTTTATSTFAGGLTAGTNNALTVEGGATANSLYVKTNGNVGIGTTVPGLILEVKAGTGSNYPAGFTTSDWVSGTTGSRLAFGFGANTGNTYATLNAQTAGGSVSTGSLVLANLGGNVGIGTTAPGYQLTVKAPVTQDTNISLDNTSSGSRWLVQQKVSGDFAIVGAGEYLRILNTSGNVGIGDAAPSFKLDVESSLDNWVASIKNTRTSDIYGRGLYVEGGSTSTDFLFQVNAAGTERLVIKGNGNVGIGTTTPISTLSVQGSLCVRDTGSCGTTAGTIYATTATITDIDLAENYLTNDQTIEAGEIVSLDLSNPEFIKRAETGEKLLGVISTKPGILLGQEIKNGKPIALKGRVPVKVNSDGGDIFIGDKITISSVSGVGMKANKTSQTIGTALEPFIGGGTSSIMVNVENEFTFSQLDFFVDSNGNVGIGTSTPEYKLHVVGEIAAQSFINISTRDEKEDISYYDDSDYESALEKISGMKVATYNYKKGPYGSEMVRNGFGFGFGFDGNIGMGDSAGAIVNTETGETINLETGMMTTRYLGLIAEEAPAEVLSVDGKGVDLYKLTTLTLSAVKALDIRLDELSARMNAFGFGEATSTDSVSSGSTIIDSLLAFLEKLGVKITDGLASFKGLVVNTLKVGSKELPSGITLYDEKTGEPYCLKIKNGVVVSSAGECANSASASASSGSTVDINSDGSASGSAGQSTTTPVITLIGNNPAEIEKGTTFVDPGATAVDSKGQSLMPDIIENTVDTSMTGEYKVVWSVNDSESNYASTTRRVIVIDPNTTENTTETTTTTSINPEQATSTSSEQTATSTESQ